MDSSSATAHARHPRSDRGDSGPGASRHAGQNRSGGRLSRRQRPFDCLARRSDRCAGPGHNLHDPGNRVRHELVRTNDDSWPLPRGRRPSTRPLVFGHRLDRRGRTRSDNSTNALFGHLQVVAAKETGIPQFFLPRPTPPARCWEKCSLRRASQIGAAAVGIIGREGEIFRSVFGSAVALLVGLCLFVCLQSAPVLGWMVP
jgi:hypothetical protein